jgi:hypothetical protein
VDPRTSIHAKTRLFLRTFHAINESAGGAFVHGEVHRKIHDELLCVPVAQIPAVLSELVFESLFSVAEDYFRDASRNGEKNADSKHSFSNVKNGVGGSAVSGSVPNSHSAKGSAVFPALSTGRREIVESFFSHYRFLCERHPAYKKRAAFPRETQTTRPSFSNPSTPPGPRKFPPSSKSPPSRLLRPTKTR